MAVAIPRSKAGISSTEYRTKVYSIGIETVAIPRSKAGISSLKIELITGMQ